MKNECSCTVKNKTGPIHHSNCNLVKKRFDNLFFTLDALLNSSNTSFYLYVVNNKEEVPFIQDTIKRYINSPWVFSSFTPGKAEIMMGNMNQLVIVNKDNLNAAKQVEYHGCFVDKPIDPKTVLEGLPDSIKGWVKTVEPPNYNLTDYEVANVN